MIIGIPKELKDNEYRVGMVPSGVHTLVEDGHQILVEKGAGKGSGFRDQEYLRAGATIVGSPEELYASVELVVKVKEPVADEFPRLRPGQIVFSYLHLSPLPELTKVLLEKRVTGLAYETIQGQNGSLVLLTPMSEIAGRMSVILGQYFLQESQGGRGVLLGGVPGVRPGLVVIVGAGTVGFQAAKMALGIGAQVTILDIDMTRLRYLDDLYFGQIETLISNPLHLQEAVRRSDLIIGAVLVPGSNAPKLLTRNMIQSMKAGSVLVDVAVDQGGCSETTRPTTHSDPVYTEEGVLHYCVTNMPGAVPRTATFALTNATLPYIRKIANAGLVDATREDPGLEEGVNVFDGRVTCRPVAEAQGLEPFQFGDLV